MLVAHEVQFLQGEHYCLYRNRALGTYIAVGATAISGITAVPYVVQLRYFRLWSRRGYYLWITHTHTHSLSELTEKESAF